MTEISRSKLITTCCPVSKIKHEFIFFHSTNVLGPKRKSSYLEWIRENENIDRREITAKIHCSNSFFFTFDRAFLILFSFLLPYTNGKYLVRLYVHLIQKKDDRLRTELFQRSFLGGINVLYVLLSFALSKNIDEKRKRRRTRRSI